ncbi:MAG TPA: hypothetical protein DCY25_12865 [Bacteroidales bacterium]|nr:hypothetical protein [Bacteroidales bacterium]
MGIMVDWKNGIRGVLAFFPVVAISSNFSTIFLGAKKAINRNKIKNFSQILAEENRRVPQRKSRETKGLRDLTPYASRLTPS